MYRPNQTPPASSCTHPIPDALVAQLPEPATCPTCTLKQYMYAIEDVQRQLHDYGGAFVSKTDNEECHKVARKAWRNAKIRQTNTITNFEDLMADKDMPKEGRQQLKEATNLWESEHLSLAIVPGAEHPTEEDYDARLTEELLRLVLEKVMDPEDFMAIREVTKALFASSDTLQGASSAFKTTDQIKQPLDPL